MAAQFATSPIPPFPNSQALDTKTFTKPPLDGGYNLPQMYDWHETHSPNHPLLLYPREKEGDMRTIYFEEGSRAVRKGAKIIRERVEDARKTTKGKVPLVAIVSAADTVSYFITFVAVQRADCVIFPISPRNSPVAIAHLFDKVKADHVLVGREPAIQTLVEDALQLLKKNHEETRIPELSPMLNYEMLFASDEPVPAPEELPLTNTGLADLAIYFHSSGSTAFPKPIPVSNRHFIEFATCAYFGGRDLCGKVLGLQVMPIFHGMGAVQTALAATAGLVLSTFEPRFPAISPTAENFMEAAMKTKSDIMFSVPAFIEAWSRKPEAVEWLSKTDGVLYGGGPLNRHVGDHLASNGINIFSIYGFTEGGIISNFLPARPEEDWEYIEFSPCFRREMRHAYDEFYELIIVPGPFSIPSVINTMSNGIEAYASSDLFVEHPEKKDTWKIYGRTDDQIMHNTGEKTNPGPLESMLNQDPHVQSCVMFGRGRFQAGIVVDPKPGFQFDPADEVKLSEFRNKIWPTIERMNNYAPQHSRLFKEMILVSKPSKPFTYTAKGTARRQAIITDYDDEINALYDAVAESAQSHIPAPDEWHEDNTKEFVRDVVTKVLEHDAPDDADVFQYGCDSLQATWIRNSLLRAVRDAAELDTRQSVDNFVYKYPTIQLLSQYIYTLVSGGTADAETNETRIEAMLSMVKKYTAKFPPLVTRKEQAGDKVVLLTGTTGGLGSNALGVLMDDPSVRRVYALNRKGRTDLKTRQREALIDRGIEDKVSGLDSGKVVLLEGDPSIGDFGIDEDILNEIKESLTHIIHNAWRVDFNLGLASFETNIKGLRNLVDLALGAGARFLFISSVGALQNAPANYLLTETSIEPFVSLGSGYTESKWVSEQIMQAASAETGLSYMNIRIGQLCGGLNGAWTPKEWLPTIVQSATVLGCLPNDDKLVSWIQIHIAARAVVDYLDASDELRITHVVHPRPVKWSQLVDHVAKPLNAAVVSYGEWLAKLEQVSSSQTLDGNLGKRLPATRLLGFYREIPDQSKAGNREAFGLLGLTFDNAVKGSKALANAVPLDEKQAGAWLGYWKNVGLL